MPADPSVPHVRTERTAGWRPAGILAGLACLTALAAPGLAGCATTVPGTAWPAGQGPAPPGVSAAVSPTPPSSFTVPAPRRTGPAAPEPSPGGPTTTAVPAPAAPPVPPTTRVVPPVAVGRGTPERPERPARPTPGAGATAAPLAADVLPNECLLDAAALTGLLGTAPAVPATDADIRRADGSTTRSCFAVGGSSSVSVNVYTTHRVDPPRYVRDAAGARPLTGTGDGATAALIDTIAGPTLQLGTARYLVTIAVAGRSPSDEQWRTAARHAAAALPR